MTNVSPELTGGAGFNFEDDVAGFFLASMLAGSYPLDSNCGIVTAVSWQVSNFGWQFDDVAVSFLRPESRTLALSVKRDRQVTATGFARWVADRLWRQRATVGAAQPFQPGRDLLGIAVGELAGGVKTAWGALLRSARLGDEKRVAATYSADGGSNKIARALLESLTEDGRHALDETVAALRDMRLIHFDFKDDTSQSTTTALWACQQAVESQDEREAAALWDRLRGIAAARRSAGGSIDVAGLVAALRHEFSLRDRVDHTASWVAIDRASRDRAMRVDDCIGGKLTLRRERLTTRLQAMLTDDTVVMIAGLGGAGKSALAKRIASMSHRFHRYVWIDGAILDVDTIVEVEARLRITATLAAMMTAAGGPVSCLVFDGVESFTPRAAANATAILHGIGPTPHARGWSVLLTVRTSAVAGAAKIVRDAGIASAAICVFNVDYPSEEECAPALALVPQLNSALVRRELRMSLRNLKLIDWVVRDADGFQVDDAGRWVGLSNVIDALWIRWVGAGAAAARCGGVLKSLAKIDGDGLQNGVGLSLLAPEAHAVLPELEARDLIRVADERVWFRHDMVGDWARLRILIEVAVAAPAVLTEFAKSPRWHDAVRLYGQRLLETDSSAPAVWTATVVALADETGPNAVARDMLLDGMSCAANAAGLVGRAWPALAANDGFLLRRLLKGFGFAAPVADPNAAALADSSGETDVLEARMRLPWVPLWPELLSVMAERAADVARLARREAADLCALFLRTIPVGAPGYKDAAALSLMIGEALHTERCGVNEHWRADERPALEALLFAATVFPDEVCALALEFARRGPATDEIQSESAGRGRLAAKKQRRSPERRPAFALHPTFGQIRLRSQFPDGPSAPVDDDFRQAVLDSTAIVAFASVRPDVAQTLLLACCLQPPSYEHHHHDTVFDDLGVESRTEWLDPMFFRGPWLSLLRVAPQVGMGAIVKLSNQATLNWARSNTDGVSIDEANHVPRVTVPSATTRGGITCLGNEIVFGWHRNRFVRPVVLTSALMALEKWLYDCVDQDSAVEDALCHLLATSRSAAILGVLASVGKYHPCLFAGPLRRLVGIWKLYEWDIAVVLDDSSWQIGLCNWGSWGERIFNLVRDWHRMSHRATLLRDHVLFQLVSSIGLQDEFAAILAAWRAELGSGTCDSPESLELIIARFDLANYRRQMQEDGRVALVLEWPESLRGKTEERMRASMEGSRMNTLPIECRKLIDVGQALAAAAAEVIHAEVVALASGTTDCERSDFYVDRRPDAILGGIAALIVLAPDWLAARPDRSAWCNERVDEILATPPVRVAIDVANSVSVDRWHSFCADIAIVRLARARDDVAIRNGAAAALMSYWNATTGIALNSAARHRIALGDDFGRLVHLTLLWAATRAVYAPFISNPAAAAWFHARRTRLCRAFVSSQIPSAGVRWELIEAAANRSRERTRRVLQTESGSVNGAHSLENGAPSPRHRSVPHENDFDTGVLRHGFSRLMMATDTETGDDRRLRLSWLRELLLVTIRPLAGARDMHPNDNQGAPSEFDRWVLGQVAVALAEMDDEDHPIGLWRPIFELGGACSYWIESFLSAWSLLTPQNPSSTDRYFDRWREMIMFATTSPHWAVDAPAGPCCTDRLWQHLLGMSFGASAFAAEENQQRFAAMLPFYQTWAERFLHDVVSARLLACVLVAPGARLLLVPAIPWLLRVAVAIPPHEWGRDRLADTLAAVASATWKWHASEIRNNPSTTAAFNRLVNLLVAQQSAVAVGLRERLRVGAI